eukprot:scaffold12366_cov148-Isochrysis_galbana.AAC.6
MHAVPTPPAAAATDTQPAPVGAHTVSYLNTSLGHVQCEVRGMNLSPVRLILSRTLTLPLAITPPTPRLHKWLI